MSLEVIDLPEFLERVQDDKELLLELLDIFAEDFNDKRQKLGTAIETKNIEEVKGIAHSIKGASGNISAKALRQICLKFEDMVSKNEITDEADQLLKDLDIQYKLLAERIISLKNEL